MHQILNAIFDANVRNFAQSFQSTARDVFYDEAQERLIHPGEFGNLRESILREFLINFIPETYGVSHGFVVSPSGFVSKQCDLVIFAKQYSPVIKTPEHQRFFPLESVVGVVEVKSSVDSVTLRSAVRNLAEIKSERARLKSSIAFQNPRQPAYSPKTFVRDQIGTFILADSVTCSKETACKVMSDKSLHSHPTFMANLLCSVRDYCTMYLNLDDRPWMYSTDPRSKTELPLRFDEPEEGSIGHLKLFFRFLLMITQDATIMHPELTDYFLKAPEVISEDCKTVRKRQEGLLSEGPH